jgi:ribonuclease P protein component
VQHLLHKSQFDAVLGTRSALSQTARTEHFFAHRLAFSEGTAHLFKVVNRSADQSVDGVASVDAPVFVGVMSAKRFAKRAVTRNLIKRQIYALTQETPLTPAAYAIRLRATFSRETYPSASSDALKRVVRAELQALLKVFVKSPPTTSDAGVVPALPTQVAATP